MENPNEIFKNTTPPNPENETRRFPVSTQKPAEGMKSAAKRRKAMPAKETPKIAKSKLFRFQGVVRFDARYAVWLGVCLETGMLVTADDAPMVHEMLLELLDDETALAITTKNIRNLFSSPADFSEWAFFSQGVPQQVDREDYTLLLVSYAKGGTGQ